MRVCLVRLPSSFLIDEKAFPPLGLMAVGTTLKLKGHDVTIYDDTIDSVPTDFLYYGVGPTTPEYPHAIRLKDMIKKNNPMAKIVIGGPLATLNNERCLKDGFDCVVCGDGEIVAEQAFINGNSMIIAEENPLDEYPIIDRTLINIKNYKYFLNDRLATTMITSQGCPYRCAFCSKNYHSVRFRSAESVIEEIGKLHSEFGYDAIVFLDDIFILEKERTEKICRYLLELGIKWKCLLRGDFIVKFGREFVQMMADSGCVEVGMGIESGSEKILSNINKGETVETIKKGIRMLQGEGIRIKGFFILGLPGEDLESLDETDEFLREMNLDYVDVRIYQPYPGSPIWKNRGSFDIMWNDIDFEYMFYKGRPGEYYGNICTSTITNTELVSKQRQLEENYKRLME